MNKAELIDRLEELAGMYIQAYEAQMASEFEGDEASLDWLGMAIEALIAHTCGFINGISFCTSDRMQFSEQRAEAFCDELVLCLEHIIADEVQQ